MKKLIKSMIILIIICILLLMIRGILLENRIKKSDLIYNNFQENVNNIEGTNENINVQKMGQNANLVQKEYKGYKVAAKLKIKKLNIDTCVLEEYTKPAMQVCVTKFFGPDANEIGNFCITGHNYITKNMFGYLYKLKKGDTFTLTDNKNGTIEYEVYEQYRAEATQTHRVISGN